MRGRVGQGQHLRAQLARRGVPAGPPGGDGRRRAVRELRLRLGPARDHRARGQRPARHPGVHRRPVRGAAPARHRRRPAGQARRGRARLLRSSTTPTRSPPAGSRSSRTRSPGAPGGPGSPPSPPSRRTRTAAPAVERARQTPAHARHPALSAAVSCARAAGDEWLVIPPHERESAVVVVPMAARHRFLAGARGRGRCRRTSRCATRPPPAGTSAAASCPSWPATSCAAARRWSPSSPGRSGPTAFLAWSARAARSRSSSGRSDVDGQLVAPRRNRYTQRHPARLETVDHRGRGRRRPDAAADGRADRATSARSPSTSSTPGWTAATRRGTRPASTGWPGSPAPGRDGRPASRAARRGSSPATSCATRCAASTCSRRGCAGSTWSPPARCPTGSTSTTRRSPSSTTRDPAGGRAADVQLARDRVRAAPGARSCRALRLPQRRLLPRPAARARRRSSARPGWPRVWSPRPPSASTRRPTRRRTSRRRGTTAGCSRTPSARWSPTTWRTRPTRTAARARGDLTERFPEALAATARSPFRSDTDLSMLSSLAQHYGLLTGTVVRRRARRAPTSTSATATSSGS